MKKLTIAEMIEKLKTYDENLPVQVEGCDCIGYASGTKFHEDAENGDWTNPEALFQTVLITRHGGETELYDTDAKD